MVLKNSLSSFAIVLLLLASLVVAAPVPSYIDCSSTRTVDQYTLPAACASTVLFYTGGLVTITGAQPSANYVLTAINGTAASWQAFSATINSTFFSLNETTKRAFFNTLGDQNYTDAVNIMMNASIGGIDVYNPNNSTRYLTYPLSVSHSRGSSLVPTTSTAGDIIQVAGVFPHNGSVYAIGAEEYAVVTGSGGSMGADFILATKRFNETNSWPNINLTNRTTKVSGELFVNTNNINPTNPSYFSVIASDFCIRATTTGFYEGWKGEAVTSGVVNARAGSALHPCVLGFRDSTTAFGGYLMMTDVNALLLNGTENISGEIITTPGAKPGDTEYLTGFFDTATNAAVVDGCWIQWNNTANAVEFLQGICSSNSVITNTSTGFPYANTTWYTWNVYINPTATNATFTVYDENGSQLWVGNASSNLPTGAGRQTGAGVLAHQSTTDAASDIMGLDWMYFAMPRQVRPFNW